MIIIGIIIVIALLFMADVIYNIKINLQHNVHNTAKICEHLLDIKNKLEEKGKS